VIRIFAALDMDAKGTAFFRALLDELYLREPTIRPSGWPSNTRLAHYPKFGQGNWGQGDPHQRSELAIVRWKDPLCGSYYEDKGS
jgi:hypothetical protein